MNEYVKIFIIGSSPVSWLPFFIALDNTSHRNFSLKWYPVIASLWFGIMSTLSFAVAQKWKLSTSARYALVTAISALLVGMYATFGGFYTFETRVAWMKYYIVLLLLYAFTYFVTIGTLEKLILYN